MTNSYGFDGNIPEESIAGVYDSENGEWTGHFFFSKEEAKEGEKEILDDDSLSVEEVNDSGWVGSK